MTDEEFLSLLDSNGRPVDVEDALFVKELLERYSNGGDGPIREGWQINVANGHSGYGVYAYMTEYPDEGAVLVQTTEPVGSAIGAGETPPPVPGTSNAHSGTVKDSLTAIENTSLVLLVSKLARRLRRTPPLVSDFYDDQMLAEEALEYLRRNNLTSPLRDQGATK